MSPAHRRQHRQAAGAATQPWGTRNYQRPSLARSGAFGGERLSVKLTGDTAGKPDGPAHRSLPGRARVAEELQRRRGTLILALSIIDRQQER